MSRQASTSGRGSRRTPAEYTSFATGRRNAGHAICAPVTPVTLPVSAAASPGRSTSLYAWLQYCGSSSLRLAAGWMKKSSVWDADAHIHTCLACQNQKRLNTQHAALNIMSHYGQAKDGSIRSLMLWCRIGKHQAGCTMQAARLMAKGARPSGSWSQAHL